MKQVKMGKLQRGKGPKAQGKARRHALRFLPLAYLPPCSFGVLFLAGCTGFNQAVGNDPLLGGPPLRPSPLAAPPPPAPSPSPPQPPPAANSTPSTAALAAGRPPPHS